MSPYPESPNRLSDVRTTAEGTVCLGRTMSWWRVASSFLLPGPGNRLCSLHPVGKGPRLLFIWYAAVQKSKVSPFSTYLFLKKSHQQGGGPGSTSPALPQQQAVSLGTNVVFCTMKDLSSVFSAVNSCSAQGRPLDFWARISSDCPACG